MAYVITDACVMCGACADACPLSAISGATASTSSTLIPVLTAVPALANAPTKLSSKANSSYTEKRLCIYLHRRFS